MARQDASPVIAVIDDNDSGRYATVRVLTHAGYLVWEGASGAEALDLARRRPDLMVLDVRLPDVDGFEVCRRIKDDPETRSIPVLHLSALMRDTRDKVAGLASGADAYLTQPVEAEELLATIRALLRLAQAERERELEVRQWHATFNSLRNPICLMDKNGRVLRANQALLEMCGQPVSAILGRQCYEVIHDSVDFIENCPLRRLRENQQSGQAEIRAWGRIFQVTVSVVPGLNGDGTRYVHVMADITDQKRHMEEMDRARRAAEAASQAKNQFLANMSHEIRTPLNGIMGLLQLLETSSLDGEQQEWVRLALESAGRLARLLSDILDLARIKAGHLALQEAPLSLDAVERDLRVLYHASLAAKGMTLEWTHVPELDALVETDPLRVRQIVFNLVGNAIKYSDSGTVRVRWDVISRRPDGRWNVRLQVADTGMGIAEERIADIFLPFAQLDGSYTRRQQGAGLGLAVVQRLVAAMGGTIAVDSVLGQGSVFEVVLPMGLGGDVALGAEPAKRGAACALPHTVLVVEDDAVSQMAVRTLLERAGHRVRVADDGEQALHVLAQSPVDVVLLDVQMPVMDGMEVARRIRAWETARRLGESVPLHADQPSPLPLVALTAHAMAGDAGRILQAGMDAYLAKPVAWDAVAEVLVRFGCQHRKTEPQ
ncbi:MAG: response regulator [Desulfomicrobiaceae bacterium]|nr:response regulator [Desulfomicrobiaceae bacterium]